jgi:rubredoxin
MTTQAMTMPWSWLPPTLWTCPRCSAVYLVRELGARCRLCGYHEDE